MKAWLIDRFEGIDLARIGEVEDPKPAAGEAVLRVRYAALNPADAYLARAEYPAKPPLPHVLGRDGVGEIVSVAPDVKDLQPGQIRAILRGPVGVSRWGTFAELVAAPVDSLVDVPDGWSQPQAAAAPLVYLTAYQALTQWNDLPRDAAVLISGASGGVGVAATQLAKAMGYTVAGLSRDQRKRETLKSIGMDLALDPTDPQWKTTLDGILGKRRINLIIDNIGGEQFPEMLGALTEHGRVSVVGQLAGAVPQFNTASLLFRRIRIGGVAVGAYATAESRAAWTHVTQLLSKTGAKPLIDQIFPFDQLQAAFAKLARGPMGKVLVEIP